MMAGKAAIESFGTIYPEGVLPRAREALTRPPAADPLESLAKIFERLDKLEEDRDLTFGMLRTLLDKAGLVGKVQTPWPESEGADN